MQYVTTCKQGLYPSFICTLFIFAAFLLISSYRKPVRSFVYVFVYYVSAGITTLICISGELDPYFFRQKMEKTRSMKEEMDREVFIFRQSRHVFFIDNIIFVLLAICTMKWRVNNYASRQGKGINRRNESIIIKI